MALASSSELWNQPRCWSWPSRYRSASGPVVVVHPGCVRAAQHVPEGGAESNHTSRMSCSWCSAARLRRPGFLRRHAAPGLDAALLDDGCRLVHDLHACAGAARPNPHAGRRAGHAPAALARDAPVGRPAIMSRRRPCRFRGRSGVLDGRQRNLAQRLPGFWAGSVNTPSPSSMRTNHCAAAR